MSDPTKMMVVFRALLQQKGREETGQRQRVANEEGANAHEEMLVHPKMADEPTEEDVVGREHAAGGEGGEEVALNREEEKGPGVRQT